MGRLASYLLLCACAALVIPTAALGKPGYKSFDRTYPVASKLCAAAERGKVPKRLKGSATQLIQACSTLRASFGDAQGKVRATDNQLKAQLEADLNQRKQACQQAKLSHDRASCKQARKSFVAQRTALHEQQKTANRAYFAAVESARKSFWSTVRSLRGGAGIKPDSPVKS
jgi:hypothetical protein